MKEKYNERYETQLRTLAWSRIRSENYKMLGDGARIITKKTIDGRDYLMIASSEGDVFALSPIFQVALLTALKEHFD